MLTGVGVVESVDILCDKHIERVEQYRPTALCPRIYSAIVYDTVVKVVMGSEGLEEASAEEQDAFFTDNEPVCCTKLDDETDWPMMELAILARMCLSLRHDLKLPRA